MKKRKSLPKLDIFNSLENVKMLSKVSSFVTKLVSLNLLRFNFILPSCHVDFVWQALDFCDPFYLWATQVDIEKKGWDFYEFQIPPGLGGSGILH